MRRTGPVWRRGTAVLLLVSAQSCASVLQPERSEVTTDFAPPPRWASGVRFMLADSATSPISVDYTTRVEYRSGGRTRVVTNRDMYRAENSEVRTRWYQLWPDAEGITLRVTLEHPDGARTEAEYPLQVQKDVFYTVMAAVYTRTPSPSYYPHTDENPNSYPLRTATVRAPGDSLWISYHSLERACFETTACR